jgi:hypothetical protein
MNLNLNRWIPFKSKQKPWRERYLHGRHMGWIGSALSAAAGVGLMYILDPDRGQFRRTRVRNRVTSAMHRSTS